MTLAPDQVFATHVDGDWKNRIWHVYPVGYVRQGHDEAGQMPGDRGGGPVLREPSRMSELVFGGVRVMAPARWLGER